MADHKRPNLKQIRIKQSVCARLDERKSEDDSYTDVIKALLNENANLKDHIEELKHDKEMLMKIAMQTHDSIALQQIGHKTIFALHQTLQYNIEDDDKLFYLKIYLQPLLDEDVQGVLHYIEDFKQSNEKYEAFLNELVSWIKYTYKLS